MSQCAPTNVSGRGSSLPAVEFLTAGATVDRIAAYCRIEQAMFALLGGWAPSFDDPDAKAAALELADHAAWRARRWYELLPTAPPGPDSFLTPTVGEREVFATARTAGGSSAAAGMSVVVVELLPLLLAGMRDHLDAAPEVSQGPIRRILDIVITDGDRDLIVGLRVLGPLVASTEGRSEADRACGEVAVAISRRGGMFEI